MAGSWDCYCAFCGAATRGCEVASPHEHAPRSVRLKWIRNERRRRAREAGQTTDEEGQQAEGESLNEEDKAFEESDEVRMYDPELVSEKGLEWVRRIYCLGRNGEMEDLDDQVFITGPGQYDDYGGVDVSVGDDPGQDPENMMSCYTEADGSVILVFPFHWCCLEIAIRAITGAPDIERIDKGVLHASMYEYVVMWGHYLTLDYGCVSGTQQTWECIPGEEFTVTDPSTIPDIIDYIRDEFSKQAISTDSHQVNLQSRVIKDPFGRLPNELIHNIMSYIELDQVNKLASASYYFHAAARGPAFWKQRTHVDMPWFWEQDSLNEERGSVTGEPIDYMAVFRWLKEVSRPVYGIEGRFMALANRKRIWNAVKPIVTSYLKNEASQGDMDFSDQ